MKRYSQSSLGDFSFLIVMILISSGILFFLGLLNLEALVKTTFIVSCIIQGVCIIGLILWGGDCYMKLRKALLLIRCFDLKSVDGVLEKYANALESSFDKELLARKRLEHSRGDVEAYASAKSSLYEAEKGVSVSKSRFWEFHGILRNADYAVAPSYKDYLR